MSAHAPSHRRTSEDGVAMIMAVVMTVLVIGFIAVFTLGSSLGRDELRTERGRMQAEIWVDAAATDISNRLERGELGYEAVPATIDGKRGRILRPYLTGTSQSHGTGSCAPTYPIESGSLPPGAGAGFYCILPPAPGQPAGTGFLNLEPSDPRHGTISFVVRAWANAGAIRPLDAEVRFGRESLSRFAVLSDAPITLDKTIGPGSLVLPSGARLHSNNVSNAANGIYVAGNVNHAAASRMTATRAASSAAVNASSGAPPCPNGNKCYITGKTVSFNSTYTAFNRVDKADPSGTCPLTPPARYPSGFRMCRIPATAIFPAPAVNVMPMFSVDIGAACVRWSLARFPLRTDSLSYPVPNDSVAPTFLGGGGTLCPASGGGALLFEGDVILQGTRPAGAPPLTIMARRPQNVPTQRVTLPSGTQAQVAEAASVYLVGVGNNLGGTGTSNQASPLGVVAEGGVYVPTYSIAAGNSRLNVSRTSLIAAGSSVALGPSFQHVAGDTGIAGQGGTEISAGGIDPCSAAANLPSGTSFNLNGTLASRQAPFLSYKRSCERGYSSRTYQFDTELGWNPPPFFPSPNPWHVVDSRVFSTGTP